MLFRFRVAILLRHTEVNYVDDIGGFRAWSANEEVIRFNVAVNKVLFVDGLNTGELRSISDRS